MTKQRDQRGRDWSDATKSQGVLAATVIERVKGWTLPPRLEGDGPTNIFISNFWPLELRENKFLLFFQPQVWGNFFFNSLRKQRYFYSIIYTDPMMKITKVVIQNRGLG